MNEHQVAIGESTCAARFWAAPTVAGGKAMIEVRSQTNFLHVPSDLTLISLYCPNLK